MAKSILIIDDDSRNIFALSAVLKSKGFQCIAAANMVEAFSVLQNQHTQVGIILLDMMMPGMDGYEAIPNLKSAKEYGYLPIIAVTAQAMAGDREKCLAAGADDYISKPIDVEALLGVLQQYLK